MINFVDKSYLTNELRIEYDAQVTDTYINESLTRAQVKVNYLLDDLLVDQASYDALTEAQQLHIKNAIGYLADYWITEGIFKEGASISGSAGALSYSQTNDRAPNYIPKDVKEELALTGIFIETEARQRPTRGAEELRISGITDEGEVEISDGKQRVLNYSDFDREFDIKIEKFKLDHGLAEHTNQLIAQTPDAEGGANQHEINQSFFNKTSRLNNEGRIPAAPTADNDPVNKAYVDAHPGLAGPKGDTGLRGLTGAQGFTGPRGNRGLQGFKGNQGDTGEQGEKGDKGDVGGGGLFFRTQDTISTTSHYKQAQEHDDHDDNYYHFFKPQDIDNTPFTISTEETFGANNKKKFWVKFSKAGAYTLEGHSVLKFASQSELRYYFLHVHEHSRDVGSESLGDVEHKIEREVSIQISREYGEINWTIAVDITEDNIDQEFVWSLKAETKKERGVRSSDPELRINDIDITAFHSRSYMFLMPTFEGFGGPKGDTGEKGETGDTGAAGTGLTDDERQQIADLTTGSAAEQVKVSKLQNIVGSYGDTAVRPTLVSKVDTLERKEIMTSDVMREQASEGTRGTQKGLNQLYWNSIQALQDVSLPEVDKTNNWSDTLFYSGTPIPSDRENHVMSGTALNRYFNQFYWSIQALYREKLFVPDGGTANAEGAYRKPANYLDSGEYYIFRLYRAGDPLAGGGTHSSQSFNTEKARDWLLFYTPGFYIVKVRVRVKYASALAQGRRSYMKIVQHEKVGNTTAGTGTSVVKSRVFTHRDHANLTDEIRTEFHLNISKSTADAGATRKAIGVAGDLTINWTAGRFFTWALKFESEVAADGSDVQTEVVEEFERDSSQYLSVRMASAPLNNENWSQV